MVVAAVLVLVAGAIVFALTRDDDSPGTVQASELEAACEEWMGSYHGAQPPEDWCASMAEQMSRGGRMGSMRMGSMRWGSTDQIRDACLSWTDDDADGRDWCASMAEWMAAHRPGGMMGSPPR